MVRCPRPVEDKVKAIIAEFRQEVTGTEVEKRQISMSLYDLTAFESALNLVDEFIEGIGQTEHLHDRTRRNNVNLARFRDWLASRATQ
jgi:hypothetical protein